MQDCCGPVIGGERIRRERTAPLSPRLALRRVLLLAEGRQFREAASVVARLGPAGLSAVAAELPIDLLVESLPHSAQLLEVIFTRLVALGLRPSISADPVVWQLVRLFASHQDSALRQRCCRLVQALVEWQPGLRNELVNRRRALDHAVEGLGCHGLTTDSSNGGLTQLHVALKTELNRHVETYKSALHRLDELSTVTYKNLTQSSHQRLLSLRYADIQQRLIDNKTLLTFLDKPALQQLRPLVETLSDRVQNDKEALFCVSQLKKLKPIEDDKPVATLLMSFSQGCGALLELMPSTEHPDSPCCSDGYHSDLEPNAISDPRRDMINRYANLYSQARLHTLDSLDSLPQLQHATQLKGKILFSVIVLSYRSAQNLRERKVREVCRCLYAERGQVARQLEASIGRHLRNTADSFPLHCAEKQVRDQVCRTLHEYPCLEKCTALQQYINDAIRLCWCLVNQSPPYTLDMDFGTGTIQLNRHARHHSSDKTSDIIKSYLWPALMDKDVCVHKAVVIT